MSGFSFQPLPPRAEDPAATEAQAPRWRAGVIAAVVVAVVVAAIGTIGYLAVTRWYSRDLQATASCVDGEYHLDWRALPGTRFLDFSVVSPPADQASITLTIDDNQILATFPGTATGDVRVRLTTMDGGTLNAVSSGPLDGTCR